MDTAANELRPGDEIGDQIVWYTIESGGFRDRDHGHWTWIVVFPDGQRAVRTFSPANRLVPVLARKGKV